MGKLCFYIPTKFEYEDKILKNDIVLTNFINNYHCQDTQIEILNNFLETIQDFKKKCILLIVFFEECLKDDNGEKDDNDEKDYITKEEITKYLDGAICETFLTRYLELIPHTCRVDRKFLLSLVILKVIHLTKLFNIPKMEPFIETLLLNIHPKNIE
jgi:hypothetical protein